MSNEPSPAKPVFNYRLRSTPDGQWLWQLSVSKNGLPFKVTDWAGVLARANQYEFHPQFIPVENSAWIGPLTVAESFQRILSTRYGIQTEIVERS